MELGEDNKPCSYNIRHNTDFPRICQFCKHFATTYVWHACYRPLMVRMGWKSPKMVNFYDSCHHFKYAKIYADKQKTK